MGREANKMGSGRLGKVKGKRENIKIEVGIGRRVG
jgi:hypothetical protein